MKKKPDYKPLKKLRLYEEVADQIKQSIFSGELKPGDQLPAERELGQMFDVGRPTIREALRTLSVLGLIECNPGFKGSIVKEIDFGQYLDAMGAQFTWMIQADKRSFDEMWEARTFIEHGIAHAVAKNASDDEIKELEDYIKKMEACGDDVEGYFAVAMDFHLKLAEVSKNRIFFMMWKLFYTICVKGYNMLTAMYPGQVSRLLNVNRIMLEAIKSKDPDEIDKAMKLHSSEEIILEKGDG